MADTMSASGKKDSVLAKSAGPAYGAALLRRQLQGMWNEKRSFAMATSEDTPALSSDFLQVRDTCPGGDSVPLFRFLAFPWLFSCDTLIASHLFVFILLQS